MFVGVGAYACAMAISVGASPWTAIPFAVGISLILAYIMSKLCFRLSGTYFSLATVGFLYIARYIVVGSNYLFGIKTNEKLNTYRCKVCGRTFTPILESGKCDCGSGEKELVEKGAKNGT